MDFPIVLLIITVVIYVLFLLVAKSGKNRDETQTMIHRNEMLNRKQKRGDGL